MPAPVHPAERAGDAQIAALMTSVGANWEGLDGLVHAVAYAPREAIAGDFLEGASRESFRVAHDISSYSFIALAKAALPLMTGRQAALVTLTSPGARGPAPAHHPTGRAA